ncbi:MAG TPA: carboxymuconolactone decarboxylase family protein [Kofleriaceae bacterium]|jgi:AhpD family alkylhydroperoxidase
MKQPVFVIPEAMTALRAFNKSAEDSGIPKATMALVHMRASQINNCAVCLDLHTKPEFFAKDTDARNFTVAAWREAPYFSEAERAALALTEAVTRIADRADPVPDEVWAEAARHYDERQLAGLLIMIASINVWNRLNVATRQIAGGKW